MKPSDAEIPQLCDFSCPFAQFPPAETAGICRTMSAVLCGKLSELVNKNTTCEWRKRREAGSKKQSPAASKTKRATPRGPSKSR